MTVTSETNEIAVLCSKQAIRHLCSVLNCSKKQYSAPIAYQCTRPWRDNLSNDSLPYEAYLPIVDQIHRD